MMVSTAAYSVIEMIVGIIAMYVLIIVATVIRILREGMERKLQGTWIMKDGVWVREDSRFGWLYGLIALVVVICVVSFPVRFGTIMFINGCVLYVLVSELVCTVRLVVK